MAEPRIAAALATLRAQVNTAHPNRLIVSDGWIGDAAHAARTSDHNPNSASVVTALDLTHDPAHGFDSWDCAEVLRLNKDKRIKYVISNGRIFSSSVSPWVWRKYTGPNNHAQHVHVSVRGEKQYYDDPAPWDLVRGTGDMPAPKPPPVQTVGITPAMRRKMAKAIVVYEARRDRDNRLLVYSPSDGSQEIAGVNNRHHPAEYTRLKALLDAGRHDEAETAVEDYVLKYTGPVTGWVTDAGLEFFLRDCAFNRGPTGAAKILQMALGLTLVDGQIGPRSRAALAKAEPVKLLLALRAARARYEDKTYGPRPALRKGLINRWNAVLNAALAFRVEAAQPIAPVVQVITTVVVGAGVVTGGVVATEKQGYGVPGIMAVVLIALIVGCLVYKLWPRKA